MSLNYGMKITKSGYDVSTATDDQLIFSSALNTLKHYITGTTSIIVPASTTTMTLFSTTVTHNLGFVPALRVYPNDGTYACGIGIRQPSVYPLSRNIDRIEVGLNMGSNSFTIYLRTADAGFWPVGYNITYYFKYYIFTQEIG